MAEIIRRDVDFDLDASVVPRDWYAGDPFATAFFNALSTLFPEGERFFVESVKQYADAVKDPDLRARVAGFIGQEAMHGREHKALNTVLAAHGYKPALGVDRWLRGFLRQVRRVLSPRSQLAATCALEHFTAIMAEQLLAVEDKQGYIHPSIRPLWLWHALEESEHKAVAFDVYRAAASPAGRGDRGGGRDTVAAATSYARRASIMLLTTLVFFAVQAGVHVRFMASRGILWKPWTWPRGIVRLWIWPGYFTRLVPAYLAYFRPRFHPDDRDTGALVARWRDALFGPAGTLRAA
jgi:predicted metal-dependent hydrolase